MDDSFEMTQVLSNKDFTVLGEAATISQSPIGRYANLDPDKLRGGYYTDSALADWLCAWAIRSSNETVLEPSCGDGKFIVASAKRLLEIGATPKNVAKQLRGVELMGDEAAKAREHLTKCIGKSGADCIINEDYFSWFGSANNNEYDCIVGNPPFIRYQTFPDIFRERAMQIMRQYGLKPNKLTNIWVPFVVAAAMQLRTNGRLALVIPAELLQVTYAAQLRSFLVNRFRQINIVACNHLFFANAQQEVVLLLAEGARDISFENAECIVKLTETENLSEIVSSSPADILRNAEPKIVAHDTEKWLKLFLSAREIALMRELRSSELIVSLSEHAEVDVGVVTGKNEYFVLRAEECSELGLDHHLVRLVSKTAHLRGVTLSETEWEALANNQERVNLLYVEKTTKLSKALAQYVKQGESLDVHKGYKCSIRTPWYSVPSVWAPDAFIFRQIYDFPRAVINHAGATSTDTIHRLTATNGNATQVVEALYTSLTGASAEIEGRSYGGGVLEIEPTEAERLLIPKRLGGGLPLHEIDKLIRLGKLQDVLDENDRLILRNQIGMSIEECQQLRSIWKKMMARRLARKQ